MASEDKKNTIEEKKEEYKELKGLGFFKKVKYSIFNIEKYPELATEGIGKALTYIAKLVVILAVVLSVWTLYQTYQMIDEGTNYLENEFPDFSYSDGTLTVDSQETLIFDNEQFGKIIVDTNTDSEETINQYQNEYSQNMIMNTILSYKLNLSENQDIIVETDIHVSSKTFLYNLSYFQLILLFQIVVLKLVYRHRTHYHKNLLFLKHIVRVHFFLGLLFPFLVI